MSLELTTIGSLVGITKSVIDIIKGATSFLSHGTTKAKATVEVKRLYGRIEQLALQLEQCERLTRGVPAWLELANRMPVWEDVLTIEASRAQLIDRDLRSLIHETVGDHFSGTFFHSDVDRLPDIPLQIEIFRAKIRSLDQTVSTIQPGNLAALKALWSQVTTQFNDARNSAWEIQRKAEDLHAALIRELRDSATEGLREIGAV